jgi:hypothetical protein
MSSLISGQLGVMRRYATTIEGNGATVLMEHCGKPGAQGIAFDNEHDIEVWELQSRPGDQGLIEGVKGLICC